MQIRILLVGCLGVVSLLYLAATDFGWQMAVGLAIAFAGCAAEGWRVRRAQRRATSRANEASAALRHHAFPRPRTSAIAVGLLTAILGLFYTTYRLGYAAGYNRSQISHRQSLDLERAASQDAGHSVVQ